MNNMEKQNSMKGKLMLVGSVGAGVLLILALFPAVVSAQSIKSNEMKTNILQQIKEKIKNTDWKPGDSLNIKYLKDVMKDSGWFPGLFLFQFIYGLTLMLYLFLNVFL